MESGLSDDGPRRNYSYRTEQSYLVWIERFARHLGTENLGAQGEEQIAEFLDSLALNERLSASSQRQALNALVFLYREATASPGRDRFHESEVCADVLPTLSPLPL